MKSAVIGDFRKPSASRQSPTVLTRDIQRIMEAEVPLLETPMREGPDALKRAIKFQQQLRSCQSRLANYGELKRTYETTEQALLDATKRLGESQEQVNFVQVENAKLDWQITELRHLVDKGFVQRPPSVPEQVRESANTADPGRSASAVLAHRLRLNDDLDRDPSPAGTA